MLNEELLLREDYKVRYCKDLEHNTLEDLVKNDYPDIYESILKDYTIEYNDFDFLREITFKGETVGFISFKYLDRKSFSVEECYIKPQYRGKALIYKDLLNFSTIPNIHLYIRKPNFAFMKMLEKHGMVEKILGSIVASGIEILIDSKDVYVNREIEMAYDFKVDEKNLYADYVYDMDSKLIYLQDIWGIVSVNRGMIVVAIPRIEDFDENLLKKFTIDKIDEISEKLFHKHPEIENSWGLWETNLFKQNMADNLIAKHSKLTDEMKNLLDEYGLDESFGFKIKNHIIDANEKFELKEKYNKSRIYYLVKNPDKIDCVPNLSLYRSKRKCPFCENEVNSNENCDYCGFDFENMDW